MTIAPFASHGTAAFLVPCNEGATVSIAYGGDGAWVTGNRSRAQPKSVAA